MEPFTVVAPTASADGYGYSAEALILAAVREHGADIALIGYDWTDERYTDPELLTLKCHEYSEAVARGVLVCYFMPYALQRYRGERVTLCMTMWETDRLPDVWASLIQSASDGVIVPSEHCAGLVRERTDRPVEVVPFGTDGHLYTFWDRSAPGEDPSDVYTFLMSGLLHYRKGVEFALRAFREEFAEDEAAELVLKTRRNFLDPGSEGSMLGDPRVTIIDGDYTRKEMRDLYHSVDCLLAPSRGEGSGLTPRDAMATGLPVIATDWGGLAEIADARYTYPVPIEGLEAAPPENTSYGLGVTGGGRIGSFARPSVLHLRAAMRECFEDREGARARGAAAAAWMRDEWTWGQCARRWLDAVESLSAVEASA